jgi:hypothetical protein
MNDFIDSARRHTQASGKPILSQVQRLEKFLQKDLAGVNGGQLLFRHNGLLMVIRNLDIEGVSGIPPKAYAPLIVDSHAVLSRTLSGELLQAVAGRCP